MIVFIALIAGVFLAYANGANDNYKGVATLYGSEPTNYRRALVWAPLSTALGSITAHGLLASCCCDSRADAWKSIAQILLAWFTTVPVAAATAWLMFNLLAVSLF